MRHTSLVVLLIPAAELEALKELRAKNSRASRDPCTKRAVKKERTYQLSGLGVVSTYGVLIVGSSKLQLPFIDHSRFPSSAWFFLIPPAAPHDPLELPAS